MSDDLDRILSSDRPPEPGPAFRVAVMDAVRREAEAPAPLPFPWRRALVGLGVVAALTVAAVLGLPGGGEPTGLRIEVDVRRASLLAWSAAGLVAGALPAWISVRLAGARG